MSKSYKEAIDKISLSDEMKKSIIKNTSKAAKKKKHNIVYLRRIAGIAACLAICLLSYQAMKDYGYTPADVTGPGIGTSVPKPDNTPAPSPVADGSGRNVQVIPNTGSSVNTIVRNDSKQPERVIADNTAADNEESNVSNPANTDIPPTVSSDGDMFQSTPDSEDEMANESAGQEETSDGVMSGNPMQDSADKEQIEKELGYSIKTPGHIPNGYQQSGMCVIAGSLVQITYENETDVIRYRTAKGTEDISGDYTAYDIIETVKINDCDVILKGNNNLYYNASWIENDNAYSVTSSSGLEKETMTDIAEYVK